MFRLSPTCLMLISSKALRRTMCVAVILTVCLIYVMFIINETKFCEYDPHENISCHYVTSEDDLLDFDTLGNYSFDNKTRNIFFHETSCNGGLTVRQACSVESAARSNARWEVHVLFSGPVPASALALDSPLTTLTASYPNVRLWRIHIDKYVEGTPVEHIVKSGKLNRSRYRASHTSDVLRFTTLYKRAGVYLDLDMVVTSELETLWSTFAARESDRLSAGVFGFAGDSVGRDVATSAARELADTFDGSVFEYNGPGVIERVLRRRCHTDDPLLMTVYNCRGVSVYDPEIAYPIHYKRADELFRPAVDYQVDFHTRMVHLWGALTRCRRVPPASLLHHLARNHCPQMYRAHPRELGG